MVHSTQQGLKLQLLTAVLIAVLAFLHYLLWIDENGVRQTHTLRISIRAQTEENVELAERNHGLVAEIADLKRGLMAIEERARSDMGMIRRDEIFYRLLEKSQPPPSHQSTPSAKPMPLVNPLRQTVKPAAPINSPALAPTVKPSPANRPAPAATVKPASPIKSRAPASVTKPAPPVKPTGSAAKPAPPVKPTASAAKPAPSVKPTASAAKPAPPVKPTGSAAKPAPTPGALPRRE